ncbi:MAG: metallophosphoesterase [Myxococcota bacterium]
MRFAVVVIVLVSSIAGSVHAAEHASWAAFTRANRFKCPAPFDTIKGGRTIQLGDKSYKHTGYKLEVQSPDADDRIVLGVLSAIKDAGPETLANLSRAFTAFKKAGVEWVVVNGDLSLEEEGLEGVFDALGGSGLPTVVLMGNAESKGSFGRVFLEKEKTYPNLVNGGWVRQLLLDDAELWTMPGYYDKKFVRQGAGCVYGKADVDALGRLKPGKGPVVLVSHGPPRGVGNGGIDWMKTANNVGDPALQAFIVDKGIRFGIFGHILESGGSAMGSDMRSKIEPKTEMTDLFVNAGSASASAESLNDGRVAHGMAMIITMAGGKAQYDLLHLDKLAD